MSKFFTFVGCLGLVVLACVTNPDGSKSLDWSKIETGLVVYADQARTLGPMFESEEWRIAVLESAKAAELAAAAIENKEPVTDPLMVFLDSTDVLLSLIPEGEGQDARLAIASVRAVVVIALAVQD